MIFVDHEIGDPLSKLTYQCFGFSDAAEIFVFLSGLACGIAYSRVLARQGMSVLVQVLLKRAGRIYCCYALCSGLIILFLTASLSNGLEVPFRLPAEHPFDAMWQALCLIEPRGGSEILILYILLTLIVVPAGVIAGNQNWLRTLTVSGLIWASVQIFPDFL